MTGRERRSRAHRFGIKETSKGSPYTLKSTFNFLAWGLEGARSALERGYDTNDAPEPALDRRSLSSLVVPRLKRRSRLVERATDLKRRSLGAPLNHSIGHLLCQRGAQTALPPGRNLDRRSRPVKRLERRSIGSPLRQGLERRSRPVEYLEQRSIGSPPHVHNDGE